jgi:hypothetical protein
MEEKARWSDSAFKAYELMTYAFLKLNWLVVSNGRSGVEDY